MRRPSSIYYHCTAEQQPAQFTSFSFLESMYIHTPLPKESIDELLACANVDANEKNSNRVNHLAMRFLFTIVKDAVSAMEHYREIDIKPKYVCFALSSYANRFSLLVQNNRSGELIMDDKAAWEPNDGVSLGGVISLECDGDSDINIDDEISPAWEPNDEASLGDDISLECDSDIDTDDESSPYLINDESDQNWATRDVSAVYSTRMFDTLFSPVYDINNLPNDHFHKLVLKPLLWRRAGANLI